MASYYADHRLRCEIQRENAVKCTFMPPHTAVLETNGCATTLASKQPLIGIRTAKVYSRRIPKKVGNSPTRARTRSKSLVSDQHRLPCSRAACNASKIGCGYKVPGREGPAGRDGVAERRAQATHGGHAISPGRRTVLVWRLCPSDPPM
jgi:hypothetical protein